METTLLDVDRFARFITETSEPYEVLHKTYTLLPQPIANSAINYRIIVKAVGEDMRGGMWVITGMLVRVGTFGSTRREAGAMWIQAGTPPEWFCQLQYDPRDDIFHLFVHGSRNGRVSWEIAGQLLEIM